MDLGTFITTGYGLVDDWHKQVTGPQEPLRPRARARMRNSEVLTPGMAAQWNVGVPWRSERGMVRSMQAHGKEMFPAMLERSEFRLFINHLPSRPLGSPATLIC
jgi:hypothetical protein